ncbi:serine hydrolase domain-containing protein [Kineococcus auxinigenes]|uniref:serine hydrolase domain-containing protein n=1 Tax=unclassified Kineococcus TaxID=2621656 RepID=UPI003D7E3DAE
MQSTPRTTSAPAPAATGAVRDPSLDLLRSAALARVLLWHALAWAWLSWVFPAMPVMFFLAGSLLTAGSARRPWWRTALRRARRLLVPFWAFGAVVLATTALTAWRGGSGARQALAGLADGGGLLRWLLPLVPPEGADGQQGWLTSHLWYVSDYLWLLVLAPLLLRCARRPAAVLAAALAGLAVLELGPLAGLPTLSGAPRTALGDLLCYGSFAVLGAAWARRGGPTAGPRTARGRAAAVAVGATALAAAAALTRVVPLERGSLNSSWLLLALAALGWLALLAAVAGPLRRASARPRVAAATRAVTARAVTVYLWHPAAIVLAKTALDAFAPGARQLTAVPVVLLLSVAGTAAAVLCLGWLEDLAAGRPARWWPTAGAQELDARGVLAAAGASTVPVAAGCAALTVALTGGLSPSLLAIPGPSDRSALGRSAFERVEDPAEVLAVRAEPLAELPAEDLQRTLDEWIAATDGIDAASVGVASGAATWDVVWEGTTSVALGEGLPAGQEVRAASLTKSVTAALVLQEAAAGSLDLDAPVPDLPGVAPLADPATAATVTPRLLLQHAAGVADYADAPGYDPERFYEPAELVSLATSRPLLFAPGADVAYSNAGFLWLGQFLEHVTARSYADLVAERVAAPLGLSTLHVDETALPGWVGSSSGGVVASPGDLARWQGALLSSDLVLDAEGRRQLTDLAERGVGLGTWPFCPCGTDEQGRPWAGAWGQTIAAGGAFTRPAERVAVMVHLQPEGERALETAPFLARALFEALPVPQAPTP